MKKKYFVENPVGYSSYLLIGTPLDLQSRSYFAVCKRRFREIAGFLPKKGEAMPITIKITKGHKK